MRDIVSNMNGWNIGSMCNVFFVITEYHLMTAELPCFLASLLFSAANLATYILPAILPAQGTNAAGPAAGAVLVPEADPATVNPDLDHDPTHQLATANPGLGPHPDPSPLLPRARRWRPSLNPDLDPGPRASPRPPRESLHQDLQARPSLMQRMEAEPHRSRNR